MTKVLIFIEKNIYSWGLLIIIVIAATLRLVALDLFPPALYSDEISQGYNAYSVLKTGHDEYGIYFPVSFRSFGDWKPPLQTYLMIPTIYIFGLNAYGLRLPGAILGTLTVGLVYLLTLEGIGVFTHLNRSNFLDSHKKRIALLASFFLAISPWHILQSRAAMLVGVTLFFLTLGLWSFLKGLKNQRFWILSSASFGLTIYGYYGSRVVVPLLLILFSVYFRKEIKQRLKATVVPIFIGCILLLPLGAAYFKQPNVILGRAKTISIFYDHAVALRAGELVAEDSINHNSHFAELFHSESYAYSIDVMRRFFQHLDLRFLIVQGDLNPPFQIPNMGVLYMFDVLLLCIGLKSIWLRQRRLFGFVLGIVIIAIVPAAFTYVTPASNRTLLLIVPFTILCAFGLVELIQWGGEKISFLFGFIYVTLFAFFCYQYFYVLANQHADWWHYGYKEMIEATKLYQAEYPIVNISSQVSVPYIFYLFFNQVDPREVPEKIVRDFHPDEFGFEHVAKYGTYHFLRFFDWKIDKDRIQRPSLIVVTGKEELDLPALEKKRILYPNGQIAFRIYIIPPQ